MSIIYENYLQCPCCKQQTLPPFTELVIAVKCQNKECGIVIKKKKLVTSSAVHSAEPEPDGLWQ